MRATGHQDTAPALSGAAALTSGAFPEGYGPCLCLSSCQMCRVLSLLLLLFFILAQRCPVSAVAPLVTPAGSWRGCASRTEICSLCSLQSATNFPSDLWEHGGGCGAALSLRYSNEGSSLAQNRSPRLKSAEGMFPSPRVSVELMPGWSSQFTPCHNPE